MRKRHFASKGVVATDHISTIYQREIFFQVDPMTLDHLDPKDVQDIFPSGSYIDVQPQKYLKYLPELEQEIFFLVFTKQKNQKDIAKLLSLSQPTISYRYRRVIAKLAYIMILVAVDAKGLVNSLPFLKEQEKNILIDLLFYTHQEMVGRKWGVRQSTVKWVFVKTRRKLGDMEREDPEKWANHLGLILLLERFLGVRVMH